MEWKRGGDDQRLTQRNWGEGRRRRKRWWKARNNKLLESSGTESLMKWKKEQRKGEKFNCFRQRIWKENICLLTMTFCVGFLCSISQVKSHRRGGGRRRMEWLYWQAGWETLEVWVAVHYLVVYSNSLPSPGWWKADLPHPIIQTKPQCCLSPLGSWLLW